MPWEAHASLWGKIDIIFLPKTEQWEGLGIRLEERAIVKIYFVLLQVHVCNVAQRQFLFKEKAASHAHSKGTRRTGAYEAKWGLPQIKNTIGKS